MTTVKKAANASDFLMLVPQLLGYNATSSVVIVPMDANNRSLGAMRFDLPPTASEVSSSHTLMGMLCKIPNVAGVIPVVYTDGTYESATSMIAALLDRGGDMHLRILDALVVGSDSWGSVFDPTSPHPLSELEPADPALGSRTSGTELPPVDPEFARLVQLGGWQPDMDIVRFCEGLLKTTPSALSAVQAVQTVGNLERPAMRDIILLTWVRGIELGDQAMQAQIDWEQGVEYPAHLARYMWGEGKRPDPTRLEAGLGIVRQVLALDPSAGCYSAAAWLSWALGRSSHAEIYAKKGMEIEADHGLCGIVLSFVNAGHLPEWAFAGGTDA
jgi:hypothetical protein